MTEDFAHLIRADRSRFRFYGIRYAKMENCFLALEILIKDGADGGIQVVHIACHNAVDYSIRPANPALIEGGPLIEHYDEHVRIKGWGQYIPGGDGEEFNPPLKLSVLLLDQTYVLADRFQIIR